MGPLRVEESIAIADWLGSSQVSGGRIRLHGPGEARGVSLGRQRLKQFSVSYREPPVWLPRSTINPTRYFAYFLECDFSGIDVESFDPGPSRFFGCDFTDVRIIAKPSAILDAHFINCRFSGSIEANFTHQASSVDSAKEKLYYGNDFAGVTDGAQFLDTRTIDLQNNSFAKPNVDGAYVLVGQGLPGWDIIKDILQTDPELQHLRYHRTLTGPRRWQWQVIYRDQMSPEAWATIVTAAST